MHFHHHEIQLNYVLISRYQQKRFHLYNVFIILLFRLRPLFHYTTRINCILIIINKNNKKETLLNSLQRH